MAREKERKCSFCGRPDSEVSLLITGINGYICNDCAEQAYQIAREALGNQRKTGDIDWKRLPKPAEIKAFLDQYVIGQDEAKRHLWLCITTISGWVRRNRMMMWRLKRVTSSWWEARAPEKPCWLTV